MSNKRLFTVLFSAISIGSSKFILASLATDANSGPDKEGVDIKAAAKKNEENIFKKLTEEQLAKLPELKNKLSSHQLNRWPAAGEDMALYRFLKARDFDIDASLICRLRGGIDEAGPVCAPYRSHVAIIQNVDHAPPQGRDIADLIDSFCGALERKSAEWDGFSAAAMALSTASFPRRV